MRYSVPLVRSKEITRAWILLYSDDVNLFGENVHAIKKSMENALFGNANEVANEVGTEVNAEETEYTVMPHEQSAG